MSRNKPLVSELRRYLVTTVAQAKTITKGWLTEIELSQVITLVGHAANRLPNQAEYGRVRVGLG